MTDEKTWAAFEAAAPEIAKLGRERLYQFGPGLAFLATVRSDGGPRLHPVCVNIVEGRIYLLIVAGSPKLRDLLRDGRYPLHSFPAAGSDDEFYITGRSHLREDRDLVRRVEEAQRAAGATTAGNERAFELTIANALYARYKPRGEPDAFPPDYLKWAAGD